jgi:carbon-monoxide dehydrogenase medium subunit
MIPAAFDYHAPTSVSEAVQLLQQHGYDAKILAGGQSLIPAMRFRLSTPAVLIDIKNIDGLEYVREENGHLAIGAMTRESALEDAVANLPRYGLLADAVRVIADPIVRNSATVGGNLAHADPANDHPAVMLAYDATIVAQGPNGTRTIAINDFFVDLFTSALEAEELLTEIQIPTPVAGSGGAYVKFERKVGDYAVAAVAVQLTMSGGICTAARVALTNLSSVPMRVAGAEQALVGQAITDAVLEQAGQASADECDPSDDLRGNVDYKRDMARILTKRAIRKAAERAEGGS